MSNAKPWIVDAAEVQGEDAEASGHQPIHATLPIREFLSLDGLDRLYVVAPKGYGKTLLLQAKRMLLQRERKGIILSPSGQLVDRPQSALPIWTKEELGGFVRSYDYWVETWEMAVKIAAVKLFRYHSGLAPAAEAALASALRSPRLREIFENPQFEVLSEIFMQILHLDRREFFALRQDVIGQVNPLFRSIHTGIAFFIDNVDECLERSLVEARAAGRTRAGGGQTLRSPEPWTLAQLALARAAFDINRLNRHIRVFAALRREAWLRLADVDASAAQMNGRVVEIAYSHEDLREIFLKNIAVESPARLRDRHAEDPIARFVGAENATLVHDLSGQREGLFDFVLRHTLLRPRELMAIGSRISLIPPAQRSAVRLREAVRRAAAENVRFYQAEVSLFMPTPDRSLFRLIDRNALDAADVSRIEEAYDRTMDGIEGGTGTERRQPFRALYRMGLLGVLRGAGGIAPGEEEPGEHQRFIRPDEIVFEDDLGTLPRSRRYLVHPALDMLIEEAHGADYARNSDRHNIIGAMLPWVEPAMSHYVLVGDIVGSTVTAWNPDFAATYPAMFASWVDEVCGALGVRHYAVSAGDSVLMVDGNAARLLLAARRLLLRMQRLREHRRTMRFGAARGIVQGLEGAQRNGIAPPLTGAVLATAARLEKAARHGTALATDEFWEGARAVWDEAAATRLDAAFKGFRLIDGKFLVQKTRDEPGAVTGLWRIRLVAED